MGELRDWQAEEIKELRAENEALRKALSVKADDAEVELAEKEMEIASLREAAREAYEVYAGSDGFIPETAPEAYQQRLLAQMAEILGNALKESGDTEGGRE